MHIYIFYSIPHIGVILTTGNDNPLEYDFFIIVRSIYVEHFAYTITVQCSYNCNQSAKSFHRLLLLYDI